MLINENNGGFHILLTDRETAKFGIAAILNGEKAASELLCRLLVTAAAVKRTSLLKTDFSAEVFMLEGGGSEIFFSPCRIRVCPKKRTKRVLRVIEFSGPDTMLAAMEILFDRCPEAGGGLYTKDGRYRIVFGTVPKAAAILLPGGLGEPVVSPAAAGHTFEYWSPVCPENAVGTVGAALSAVKRR